MQKTYLDKEGLEKVAELIRAGYYNKLEINQMLEEIQDFELITNTDIDTYF